MVPQDTLLVILVKLVDCLPKPPQPRQRGRGHPIVYADPLFLKALVIMIVRHLHTVHELLSVVAQPTAEMRTLRLLVMQQGRFPSRRTWERRQISAPSYLACSDWLLGSSVGRPDPAMGHLRASSRY
jgi:hypothetical protein